MAAKKKPTQSRAKASNYGGFGNRKLQKAAARAYYGKGSNVTHIKKTQVTDWLSSQGLNQGQPVNLGGVRFTQEGSNLTSKGQRSDLRGGAAYDAPASQQSYIKGFGPAKKKTTTRKRRGVKRRAL